jgi:signal transduction histidine kinase
MRVGIQFRLFAFGSAIVLAALLMGWAAHIAWQRFQELTDKLTPSQIESFQTGDHFRATLQELNSRLARFTATKAPEEWLLFGQECTALNGWIDQQRPSLQTAPEVAILNRIDSTYDHYLDAATNFVKSLQASDSASVPPTSRAKVEEISKGLLTLAYDLRDAHRESLTKFLDDSRRSLNLFRRVMFGALFFLMAALASLAIMVYREMIMPLRMKLVESTAIIERQEKLASLGMLAAGVAHEIRNPLTAIKAWMYIQNKHLRPGSQEHSDAGIIENEIHRLERIVKDVLLFAKPSEPQFAVVSAEKALKEAQTLLGPPLAQMNIKLEVEPGPQALVRIDPQQFKQVLINLIQNGADSIMEDGTVTLRARTDTMRLKDRVREVVILEICDTGRGIAPDVEKRLFDPFFTTKETGTGLGLSIAARIVEKHGGILQYQTQVSRGTTFGIVLPRVET